jgi:chemotaxis protein MotB
VTSPRVLRARAESGDHWPGFVDALATLLIVVVFLLSLFVVAQYALSNTLSERDEEVASLSARLAALADQLSLAQAENQELQATIGTLRTSLDEATAALTAATERNGTLSVQLEEQEDITEEQANELALLNQQMAMLNATLAELSAALEAAEARDAEQQAEIANLGRRLNQALASQVARLALYRSEFFEQLMNALSDRTDVRVVGDRFVFETDVLFGSGSDALNPEGLAQLDQIAQAILDISEDIPDDLEWVIRIDGHTDRRPINTPQFPSNWELSTARAISVVKYFEGRGVPSNRLVAAGFGDNYPLAPGATESAYAQNRRIELKLDAR